MGITPTLFNLKVRTLAASLYRWSVHDGPEPTIPASSLLLAASQSVLHETTVDRLKLTKAIRSKEVRGAFVKPALRQELHRLTEECERLTALADLICLALEAEGETVHRESFDDRLYKLRSAGIPWTVLAEEFGLCRQSLWKRFQAIEQRIEQEAGELVGAS